VGEKCTSVLGKIGFAPPLPDILVVLVSVTTEEQFIRPLSPGVAYSTVVNVSRSNEPF